MADHVKHIVDSYAKREVQGGKLALIYADLVSKERENVYRKILLEQFSDLSRVRILEIGAGSGYNIPFFISCGVLESNIYVNELLPERVIALKTNFPNVHVLEGDAMNLKLNEKFDLVFQSTVFTSILDTSVRKRLANKMVDLIMENGAILWYDFVYDNPRNKAVKGVSLKEILNLFPGLMIKSKYKVTLAPPIGRKIGVFYNIINRLFPFLRTHLILLLKK